MAARVGYVCIFARATTLSMPLFPTCSLQSVTRQSSVSVVFAILCPQHPWYDRTISILIRDELSS